MKNLDLFKSILEVQSVSNNQVLMVKKIKSELKRMKNVSFYEHKGNIYATKLSYKTGFVPCIVSHMDTVHRIVSNLSCLQVGDNITGLNRLTMQQSGIGGDDKVGIFICLECLQNFDNCKVVFFCDEETGCNGSYNAKMKFFNDCSFVLQCDRKGNKDFVINASGVELSGDDFQNTIFSTLQSYGYGFSDGGITDVMALKENGLSICVANMSCGYYNPHQSCEYVNIIDVENCKNMVFELFSQFGNIQFLHTEKRKTYKHIFDKFDLYSDKKNGLNCCENCDGEVDFLSDINDYFCNDCFMYGKEIKEGFVY